MSGKLAVVTGGSSGLGLATVAGLAGAGAEVIIAGRDDGRLRRAAEQVRERHPGALVRGERLDLASLASVAAFAARLTEQGRPLDLLVDNAAVLYNQRRALTEDGFELTMATNHLGHFALTGRLVPLLLRAPAPRVVTVSSLTAKVPALDLADLMSERNYRPLTAYVKSKMAVLLFAVELQRRATRALTSVAVNPGNASTGLYRHGPAPVRGLNRGLDRLLGRDTENAASVILYGATAPDVVPGGYYTASGLLGRRGTPRPAPLPRVARDHALARDLWLKSEALTGVRPSFPARSLTV